MFPEQMIFMHDMLQIRRAHYNEKGSTCAKSNDFDVVPAAQQ